MVAMPNVALGVPSAHRSSASRRGTPCMNGLLRLACSLLLFAPAAYGRIGSSAAARIGVHLGQTPDLEDALDAGAHEAKLAQGGAERTVAASADAARLVNNEQAKLSAASKKKLQSMLPSYLAADDGTTNYIIGSFPEFRCVNYVRLPNLVWRPLVISGLALPKAMVVDQDRNRLYIADAGVVKIVWYQLLPLPDGALITGGRQNTAVMSVAVRNMALDQAGNLWFSAKSTPVPPIPSIDAIYKQPVVVIDQALATGTPIDPLPQITTAQTKSSVSPLVLDAFNIFYGNDADGSKKGSVVKSGQGGGGPLNAMADNADSTLSVAVTPTCLFYGADGGIYGVAKTKTGASCGADGKQCAAITNLVKKPTAMLWDGDGTIYVADSEGGAIYSFASGSVSPHALDKIIDAGEIWGMGVFSVTKNKNAGSRSVPAALFVALTMYAFQAVLC